MRFTCFFAHEARFENSWKIEETFREVVNILGNLGNLRGGSGFHGLDVLRGRTMMVADPPSSLGAHPLIGQRISS